MLASLWRQLVMKRMARAAARGGRPVLRLEGLEDRTTPAGIFAVPSAAGTAASVTVFDAATRQPKFTVAPFPGFTGGVNVATGDVNGDGTADVVVAPKAGGGPVVNVYSGTDGTLLKSFTAGDDASRAGVSVAAADFDADGLADIVVGTMRNGQPLVQVFRFADLTVLHGYTPFTGAAGVSVAAADVTGDGTPDVVAGAGPGGGPQVVVFDGRTDGQVRSFFAFEATFTGGVGVSAGDTNGDGRADILVSAGFTGGPRVSLFAGSNGAVLANFFAYGDQLRGGVEATLTDSDGNGTLDIVTTDGATPKAFDARTMAQLATPLGGGLTTGAPQDTTAPTVTLSTTAANPTGTSPLVFTATFSEAANAFSAAGVTVTNGTAANVMRVDAKTYTFDVTPATDGPVTVTVAAGAAADAAGNASTASASVSRTYDATGAAVTANSLTTNDTTPTLTGTVADGTATVSVSAGGQTVAATVTGTTWSATLPTALAEGTYPVTATSTDSAGNSATATATLVIDVTAPTAAVTSTAPDPTSTSPIPFTATFSEDVTGFSAAGLSVTNGTVSGFTQVDARTYTFAVSPLAQGTVSVSVNAAAATDAAGNGNTASAAVTRTFDSAGPVVTANPLTTNDTTPTLTGTVDDPNATVTVVVDGQTVTATVTGTTWTADVPVALAEGTYDITVTATDALGNAGTTTLTAGLVIDLTAPTAAVTTAEGSPTNDTSLTFTVTFSEAVTGFDQAGLTVTGGSVFSFTPNSATAYTVVVTPAGDGPVGVSVNAGAATDPAGNTNPASNTASVVFDGTPPTATVDSTAADPTAVNPIPFTVTFTEDVTGFTAAGLSVTGGSVMGFTATGAQTYSFSVGPNGPGLVSVSVNAGAATDAAGNPNPASAPATRVFNGTVTTATITSTEASPTNAATIPVTVTFTDDVTGFDQTDLVVTNGSTSNFVAVDGATYTFDLTPGGDGDVTVSIAAAAALDSNNTPTAAATFTITSDTTAPTAVVAAPAGPTNANPIAFTVTFSEVVTGFGPGGVTVTNGTVAGVSPAGGASYTVTVTPAGDGPVSLSVNAGAGADAAGNPSSASNTASVVFDGTAPTATVSTAASDPTGTSPIGFTVTFDEDVTGFGTAGLDVTNGTVSNFVTVDARTYTFDVTPGADGPVGVTVLAGAATDAAGNPNPVSNTVTVTFDGTGPVAAANPLTTNDPTPTLTGTVDDPAATVTVVVDGQTVTATVTGTTWTADVPVALAEGTYDITVIATDALGNAGTTTLTAGLVIDLTAPTAAVTTALTSPTSADPIPFTLTFTEDLTGFDQTGVTITGGTLFSFSQTDPRTYTVVVTPGGDGLVSVAVNAGVAQDAAGNLNPASPAGSITFDGTAPTATVSTAASDPTGTSPIGFTVTFDEDVTGFGTSGLDVTNGTASNFVAVDARTYTFDVTPGADGPVGVTVLAGAATDAAGNPNPGSNTVTVIFDGTGPVAAANPLTTNDPTPTLTGTVDDPDATVTVVVGGQTITASVTGTTWTADVPTPLADGTYDITVTAADALGNSTTTTLTGGLVIDTTAPSVAISPPSAPLTAGGPITFTVTYADATALTVMLSDGDVMLVTTGTATGTASVSGSGLVWTVTVSGITGDGSIGIVLAAGTATDAAGNAAGAAGPSVTFAVDNTAPAAPVVGGLTAATDTGASATDGVTNNPAPTFTGTAEPGSTVEVFADDGTGPVSLGTTTADPATGAWSLTLTTPLADGAYTITAVATDAVGNVSPASGGFALVIDTADPTATVDPTSTGGVSGTATDAGGSGVVLVQVSIREPGVSGLYYDVSTQDFTSATPLFFDVTDDSVGGDFSTWSYALPAGTSGGYTVTARVTDLAGNQADSPAATVLVS